MRKRLSLLAGGLILAGTGLVGGAPAATANPPSTVVGHTYVNLNPAGPNTVAALDRHADGSLTPTPGSPFPAGGAGLGTGLGSQGAIQATPDGRYLLAVDAGSNQISVLRLTARGVPERVGRPVSSGGVQPVSIAINRYGLVYVANVGDGGSNYAGFVFTRGRLIPLPHATVAVPEGSGVGDVLFNSTGDRLVGVLRSIGGSPVADGQTAPCWVEISHDGRYLFAVNTGSGNLSRYAIQRDGSLALIGTTEFTNGLGAVDARLSPDGRTLSVTGGRGLVVSTFAVHGGNLTELPSSPIPLPAGNSPAGIVVL